MTDQEKGRADCLEIFEAAYENLKARHHDELDKLKQDIRRMHRKVRTEVITGDPKKADEMSQAAVEWMNGVQVIFQEAIKRPERERFEVVPPRGVGESFVINDGEITVTVMKIRKGKVVCAVFGAKTVCTDTTYDSLKKNRPELPELGTDIDQEEPPPE